MAIGNYDDVTAKGPALARYSVHTDIHHSFASKPKWSYIEAYLVADVGEGIYTTIRRSIKVGGGAGVEPAHDGIVIRRSIP